MNKTTLSKIINYFYYTIFLLMLVIFLIQCTSDKTNNIKNKAIDEKALEQIITTKGFSKFEFTKELHRFGEISAGEIAVCDFFFKNVGSKELVIKNIETSCGCTAVKWEKKPIGIGAESHITVEFDSKGRYGKQYKVITVFCNTFSGTKELVITAQVK